MNLDGKKVLVVGSRGRLGTALLNVIDSAGGQAIGADLEPTDERSDHIILDITSSKSVQNAVDSLVGGKNGLDAIVNCAYPPSPNYGRSLFDVEYDDFCTHLNRHLGGYFLVTQKFAQAFSVAGRGSIVNLSSIYGLVAPRFEIYEGTPMTTPVEYAAVKSSLIHLTKYFAKYLKGKNVRVNCVSFGGIKDGQPQLFLEKYEKYCLNKGMLDAADVVQTILFLLSDFSAMINGQNIIVDDGFTL